MALSNLPGIRSIRFQLVVIMVAAYVIVGIMTLTIGYVSQQRNLQTQLQLRAKSDAKILAAGSVSPLINGTLKSNANLASLLAALHGAEGVSDVAIRGRNGCILASYRQGLIGTGCRHPLPQVSKPIAMTLSSGSIEGLAPIVPTGGGPYAVATVTLSSAAIQSDLRDALLLEVGVRAVGLVFYFLLSLFIAQFLLGRMHGLATAAKDLRRGKLGTRVPVRGQTEVDTVAGAFNEMAEALETRIRHLSFLASSGAALPRTLRHEDDVEPILEGFGTALHVQAAGLLNSDGPVAWWPEELPADSEVMRSIAQSGKSLGIVERDGRTWMVIPVPGDAWFVAVRTDGPTFNDEERDVIVNFAYQVGIAADNARLVEAQQEALQVKDQFLSIVSHELRTPLTTMKGYAQLLTRKLAHEPDSQKWATSIDAQIGKLSRLVDDLLDVTRFARGQFELRRRETALAPILDETVSRFRIISPQHMVVLRGVDRDLRSVWDRDRLEQVLNNLVSNAIKYSPEGGEIEVSAHRADGSAVVTVRDQGIGISQEDREKLFDRFYRASPEKRGGATGLGLGLYVTRRVVEAHGGTVGVTSEPGQGSEFYFTLPLVPAEEEQESSGAPVSPAGHSGD
jgi:signal transduction histidine kinase